MKYLLPLLLVSAVTRAQDSGNAFTLADAQKYALEHKAAAVNAAQDILYAKKQVMQTAASGFPQASVSAGYQSFIDIPTQVIPANAFDPAAPADLLIPVQFGVKQNMSAGVTATQLIFDGRYLVGLQSARTYVTLSEKSKEMTDAEVQRQVAKAYYSVLVVSQAHDLTAANLATLEKIYFETDQLYKNGFAEKMDVDRLELALINLRAFLSSLERNKELTSNLLKFQMGFPIGNPISLTDSLHTFIKGLSAASAQGSATTRTEYELMLLREKLMMLNLSRYRANRLPSAGAMFNHSQFAYRNEFNFFNDDVWYPATLFGVNVSVPLVGFQNNAAIQQAKIDLMKVRNEKSDLEQALTLDLAQARTTYAGAWDQYQSAVKGLGIATEIHRIAVIKFNEGVGSSFELSGAQSELNISQANYTNALFGLLNAKEELDRATGL